MSESKDSIEVDDCVSLNSRLDLLIHCKLDIARVKALKESVRNQNLERDENVLKKTKFDRETEDESSSKEINRADSELSVLQGKISDKYKKETEDESFTMKE